ncbi:MAG: GldG family protein [Opitutaceae bacterium]|nr:GldG family protein [Opitutaceae bacterium]
MNLTDSFRAARLIRLINLLLQALLFLTLIAGLNYLSVNHAWRFDLTHSRLHSLSPETLSYLERLERDVDIVVTLTEDAESEEAAHAFRDVSGLLREYEYVTGVKNTGQGRLNVKYLDVYQRRRESEALGIDQPNQVVLLCGARRRVLTLQDLYVTKVQETQLRREAFLGEAVVTAAILDVSSPAKKKIYFLTGHGEISPDDVTPRGLSQLRDELFQRNFALASLDLALEKKIPDDAALLVCVGPQAVFRPFEEELLRRYLSTRAGRLILALSPGFERTGLENLLFDWGIWAYDNLIFDQSADYLTDSHELLLYHYLPHPITQTLINNSLRLLIGPAREVMADPGRPLDDSLNVRTLVATGATAWGEKSYRLKDPPVYTPGVDQFDARNGLGVLAVSERVKPANLALSVPGGRLVVFGAADVVTNNHIINIGNLNLFLATINWAVDRDNQLNIAARPIQRFQLALSQDELIRLRLVLLLAVPGAAALLGLLVYWARRQ